MNLDDGINRNFQTKILNFKTKYLDIEELADIKYDNVETEYSKMTSCFVSKSNYIWTVGFIKENQDINDFILSYYIFAYSPYDINELMTEEIFKPIPFLDSTFFKIVHLRDDIGVLFYYLYPYNNIA